MAAAASAIVIHTASGTLLEGNTCSTQAVTYDVWSVAFLLVLVVMFTIYIFTMFK